MEVLSLTVVALIISKLCDWSWVDSVIFNLVVISPGPILARTFLKRLTVSNKLETFMVGEALMSNLLSFFLFLNLSVFVATRSIKPEDISHEVLFGPILGYFAAKAVSYWLARIIKDTVNTVSIVIASVYFIFILADLIRAFPVLATVVLGICMSGSQSNIEEQAEEIVLRILNVITNFFNCNLFILVGIEIYRHAEHLSTPRDVFNVFLIFFLSAIVRAAVIILLSRILRNGGFCLSVNNLLVLCTCNIRGSLTIIMSRYLILRDFPVEKPRQMFTYALAQVALSLLINTVIANLVIRYDGLALPPVSYPSQTRAATRMGVATPIPEIYAFNTNKAQPTPAMGLGWQCTSDGSTPI
ncbi:transposon tf2-1 polyprotein [Plakobranchus ocellatus]|uniref:Transposon tf2-1 polyprotein n=1 Tax=Plakobranchus ocellatus TaxID=259542 RepID=A0AAV3YXI3_9GAST|nr:transposon tf2-1 polyprotein [Plakobranchus ocellatus]